MGAFASAFYDGARAAGRICKHNGRDRRNCKSDAELRDYAKKQTSACLIAEVRRGQATTGPAVEFHSRSKPSPNMKRLAFALLLPLIALPSGFARDNSLLARVTVYWAHGGRGADRYTRQHKSATGMRLHVGHCAVDPRKIPYGSRVVLPDGTTLAAVDTGSAVRNRKAARHLGRSRDERSALVIDKFFETKREALAWANANPPFVNVKVIPPNVAAVANTAITNSKTVALTPLQTKPATGGSFGAMTIVSNSPAPGPTGGIIKNPLGRLGR